MAIDTTKWATAVHNNVSNKTVSERTIQWNVRALCTLVTHTIATHVCVPRTVTKLARAYSHETREVNTVVDEAWNIWHWAHSESLGCFERPYKYQHSSFGILAKFITYAH